MHDVFEDSSIGIETIEGLTAEQKEALLLLTKKKDADYMSYIKNIKNNKLAREVKIADLEHNMDLSRLATITEKDKERHKKYLEAYMLLK